MPTIAEHLRLATAQLEPGSESPRLDAELLLSEVIGRPRAALIAHGDEPLTTGQQMQFERLLLQRLDGAPVAYLTGRREFWSLPLQVSPAVLVPRPETEALVERVLARLPVDRDCAVLDLGTGSGAIAIAIASERPRARVTAVDCSAAALAVAARNGAALQVANVEWLQGSWFEGLPVRTFDAIVSNPPYIGDGDAALAKLRAEPLIALTAGPTGLEAFAAIAAGAPRYLRVGGLLAFEHGATQGGDVARLLRRHGFFEISLHTDHAGLPRVTLATFNTTH